MEYKSIYQNQNI